MLMDRIMPRKLRGFTLTEAAIVLGIVGLILSAIWVAAASVYNNLRVSTTSTQLIQIVQSIRSMHATQQTMGVAGGTDVTLAMARAGALPKDMIADPNNPTLATIRDSWGGFARISAATAVQLNGGVDGAGFLVTFAGLPRGACSDLLVRTTGSGRDTGLAQAGRANSMLTVFPVDVATATTNCNNNASNNTLGFVFTLRT